MKPNRITSAGAKADSTTTADDMQVSQTIAKPNVIGMLPTSMAIYWQANVLKAKEFDDWWKKEVGNLR